MIKLTKRNKKKVNVTTVKGTNNDNQLSTFIKYMAPSVIDFKVKHGLINDTYKRYYYMSFPNYIEKEAWLNEVLKHPFVNATYYVSKADQSKFMSSLKTSMNYLDSYVRDENISQYAKNEASNKFKSLESLQQNILDGNEEVVNLTTCIEVMGRSIEELDNNANKLKASLNILDIVPKPYNLFQKEAFQTSLPLDMLQSTILKKGTTNMPTLSAASLYPFSFTRYCERKGIYLGRDRMNGMVIIDLDERMNDRTDSNIVVLGKTGTGKSTLMKKLIKDDLMKGKKVIVLDPESEYKDLRKEYGGLWYNCAGNRNARMNIFDITDFGADLEKDEKKHPLELQMHKLRNYFALFNPLLEGLLMSYLELCIDQAYKDKGIGYDSEVDYLKKLKSTEYPIMEDVYKIIGEKKEQSKEGSDDYRAYNKLLMILRAAVEGADSYLNGHTNIELDNNFIVLDVHELLDADPNVLRSEMFKTLHFVWKEATKDRQSPAEIYLDEYHVFGNKKNIATLIALKNFVKRFRKYEAGLRIGTQNPSDVLESSVKEYTAAILSNSSYNFIFGLVDNDLKELDKLMHFSESEQMLLAKKERGKALFVIGSNRIELEIKVSQADLNIFSKKGGR